MSDKERFEVFRGKFVDIGIPNYQNPHRLFMMHGKVIEIDETYITLRIKDGFRKIPFNDVIEIREVQL